METCPVCGKMLGEHSAEEYVECKNEFFKNTPQPQVVPVPEDEKN